jgi:hypothetical protein
METGGIANFPFAIWDLKNGSICDLKNQWIFVPKSQIANPKLQMG